MNRRNHHHRVIAALLVLVVAAASAYGQAPQGPRPENIKYPPLDFKPPKPAEFRSVLSNGLIVYIAEDHEIPWFEASLFMRTGPFLEPPDKLGVEDMTPNIMREGGTTAMNGEDITERMDFLAGNVSATRLSLHMRHMDEGLKIWLDILNNPAFPEDKIRRARETQLVGIRNRNKNISQVAGRTFARLVYGENSPMAAEPTEATMNGIVRDDLVRWHQKYWGANNAVLVVAGDFRKAEMLTKIENTFGKWRKAEKAVPAIPKVEQAAKAGVYIVQPEVIPNQGIIRIGHLGIKQDDPDYPAVNLMNYILGGGSFSSRITRTVRSNYGLAYSTSSSFAGGILYPGTFAAFCQTKNSTVVFAAQLMLNEIEGMRDSPVSREDLEFAKTARINAFPSMFGSISQLIGNFARLEFDGRPMDYYDTYISRYEKLTVEDIKRMADKYLRPDKMIIMVAGNIAECRAGADKMLPNQAAIDAMAAKFGGRTIDGLAKKYGDGTVTIIPLK